MNSQNILGLDVGDVRIGVARVNTLARIPEALCVLKRDEQLFSELINLLKKHDIGSIVVGLPRNMSGEKTAQSVKTEDFVNKLRNYTTLPVIMHDETLTTQFAKKYMSKKDRHDDAYAAANLLESYVNESL